MAGGLNQLLLDNQNIYKVFQQLYSNATTFWWHYTDSWLVPNTFQDALQNYYQTFTQATVICSNPLTPNIHLTIAYTKN